MSYRKLEIHLLGHMFTSPLWLRKMYQSEFLILFLICNSMRNLAICPAALTRLLEGGSVCKIPFPHVFTIPSSQVASSCFTSSVVPASLPTAILLPTTSNVLWAQPPKVTLKQDHVTAEGAAWMITKIYLDYKTITVWCPNATCKRNLIMLWYYQAHARLRGKKWEIMQECCKYPKGQGRQRWAFPRSHHLSCEGLMH